MPQGHTINLKIFKKKIDIIVKEFNETKNEKIAFASLCGIILLLEKEAKSFRDNLLPMYETNLEY